MTSEIQVQYHDQAPGLNPQDLVELGALQVATGMTISETRAFIAKVQQLAVQVSLTMAPELLESIRKIQEQRLLMIYTQIRLLPQYMGHISRDRVLAIIQSVAAQAPQK